MGLFSFRIYGVLFNRLGQVLLSQEFHGGKFYIKFPGGGLEYGEGTTQCLQREFMEELGIGVEVHELLHLTNRFIRSEFYPDTQVLAAYYRVSYSDPAGIPVCTQPVDSYQGPAGPVCVFWKDLDQLDEASLSLPTDQQLVPVLKSTHIPT